MRVHLFGIRSQSGAAGRAERVSGITDRGGRNTDWHLQCWSDAVSSRARNQRCAGIRYLHWHQTSKHLLYATHHLAHVALDTALLWRTSPHTCAWAWSSGPSIPCGAHSHFIQKIRFACSKTTSDFHWYTRIQHQSSCRFLMESGIRVFNNII